MRIQDRIYQAFTGSRPNVLGKVLEDISPRKATKTKHKKLSERTMQLIATAASIAILISAGFGGFAYYRDYFAGQKPGGDSTLNGTNPGITQPTTPPTDPNSPDELLMWIEEDARQIICPGATAETLPVEVVLDLMYPEQDRYASNCYVASAAYEGYHYALYYTQEGVLSRIGVLRSSDAQGYISQTVAQRKALLAYAQKQHGPCVASGSELVDDTYYKVRISGEYYQWSTLVYIDAYSGELAAPEDTADLNYRMDDMIYPRVLMSSIYMPPILPVQTVTEDGIEKYCFTRTENGYCYEFKFSTADYTLLSIAVLDCECEKTGHISEFLAGWIAQMDIDPDYYGRVHGIDFGLQLIDDSVYYVEVQHEGNDANYAYYIDARSGQILQAIEDAEPITTALEARNIALAANGHSIEELKDLAITRNGFNHAITVSYQVDSTRYQTVIAMFSGKVLSQTERNETASRGDENRSNVIGWQKARDIALEVCGRQKTHMIGFDYTFANDIYQFDFVFADASSTCRINARTGGIQNSNAEGNQLSQETATDIALNYVNLSADQVSDLTATLSGNTSYLVSFEANSIHYEITVHDTSGLILEVKLPITTRPQSIGFDIFAGYNGNWLRQGLTHAYDSPAQLQLAQLFSKGFDTETTTPTDEEIAYLNTVWPTDWPQEDLIRLPAEQMDQVLQQYYGIRLEELGTACFDGLVYMESTNCYYCMAGNSAALELNDIKAYRVETISDGSLRLYYYLHQRQFEPWVVTLRQNDREWVILSNQHLEDITDPNSGEPDVPDGSISFWGAAELAMEYTGLTDLEHVTVTGNRIDDHYVIYLNDTDILYKVTVKAYHSFDILDFEMIPLVEGGIQYKFESMLMDHDGWYNAAIAHQFASLEELQLKELFCTGFPGESTEFTAEELAPFPEEEGYYGDLIRLPKEKMDAVLRAYFGTFLSQLDGQCFAGLKYLESTGCYYSCVSDVNRPEEVVIWGAEFIDFELLQVRYRLSYEDGAPFFLLTLRYLPGGSWQIISNVQE